MSMTAFATFLGVSQGWLYSYYHGAIPSGRIAIQIINKLNGKISIKEIMSMNGRGPKFNIYG
ncbi:unnamed protein product [marine sediment metagenome]|uniref:HTH cro/C1-type domain-containing protein n=1 Tax=marine sediment metagenome TaxID=412755 RepID=X0Y0Z9_9ZZZZ